MPLDQSSRTLQIATPLGENELILTAFRGVERLSDLFNYHISLIGDDIEVDSKDIVGKDVSLYLARDEDVECFLHGYVREFALQESRDGRHYYSADVVPWLWFLTQTTDCRIFQNQTVPDIVEKIFTDLGFSSGTHFDTSQLDRGAYKEWEYCVQYRETDFEFVSRLLEQEGIFYYFQSSEGNHVMMLADSTSAYHDCDDYEVIFPQSKSSVHVEDHITSWQRRFAFHSGGWAHTDYNFKTPATSLMASETSVNSAKLPGCDNYEVYDYPGEYTANHDGAREVRVRMEEREVDYDTVQASSQCRSFRPGGKFKIKDHPSGREVGQGYMLTSVEHTADGGNPYETGAADVNLYKNSFTCIPDNVLFRPKRRTPRPTVSGIQTAVVVGPPGEEIYTDEYGRVKVHFHWDREGQRNEDDSCWIRVASSSAGRKWGFFAIPRIGQEVVVDFLEGDPDRPLIVGSVYNADQMPHYDLPDEKTKTYFKTNTTKGGDGYNELMFDDKEDDERVYIHAQKNLDVRVRNDSKARVFGNMHQIVGWEEDGEKGGDFRQRVYQDKHLQVEGSHFEDIQGDVNLQTGIFAGGEDDSAGNMNSRIFGNKFDVVRGKVTEFYGNDQTSEVWGSKSLDINGDLQIKTGGDIAIESGTMKDIHLKAGANITIEAAVAGTLTLKAMGGFITIGPTGICIQGLMVDVNSGGSPGSGKGCSVTPREDGEYPRAEDPSVAWNSSSGIKSSPD